MRDTNTRAFTLIELIVVIVIVGILASVAVPSYTSYVSSSKDKANTQLEDLLNTAIDNYTIEFGEYPTWDNGAWDLFNYVKDGYGARGNSNYGYYSTVVLEVMKTAGMNAYCSDTNGYRGKTWQELTGAPTYSTSSYNTWRQSDFGIQATVVNGKVESVTVNKDTTQGC